MVYEKRPYKKLEKKVPMSHEPRPMTRAKRQRKLLPLMTEEQKQNAGILDLSFDFACRITRLYQYLTDPVDESWVKGHEFDNNHDPLTMIHEPHEREFVMSKQVYRSGTSIGANAREAKHAQSDADFLNKYSVSYKEADETDYWINLLHANGYLTDEAFNSLDHDMTRILKVLTAIIKKLKAKLGRD